MHDLVIVGGGAIGLYLARLCKDLDVLVIDKNRDIGNHTCSGLYSTNIQNFFQIQNDWVENKIDSAILHSPNGNQIKLKKDKLAAFVLDRDKMEKSLAEGVNVKLGTNLEEIKMDSNGIVLKTNNGEIKTKMIVGCDGANSVVAKHFGVGPKEIVNGLIALTNEINKNNYVELWFNKNLTNDGFLWKIPRGNSTEYGMLGKNAQFQQLEEFFNIKNYEKRFGFIPIGTAKKTYFSRTLLMGNSVGITKPWSGGGLIYGFTCGNIASKIIYNAFKENDFSENKLKEYETEWKKQINKSINFGMIFRKIYKISGNKRIEFFFKILGKLGVNKLDMDYPAIDLLS